MSAFAEFLGYFGARLVMAWRAGLAERARRRSGGVVSRPGALDIPEPVPEFKILSMPVPGAAPIFGDDEVNHAAMVLRQQIGIQRMGSEFALREVKLIIAALGGRIAEAGPWIVKGTPRPIDIPILGSGHGARQAWIKIDAGDEIAVLRRRRP